MPINKCEFCLKEFKYNYLLERHQNRKIKCKKVVPNELYEVTKELIELKNELKHERVQDKQETITNKCTFCNKLFSRQDALQRHLKSGSCKVRDDNISIYERELNIEHKEVDLLNCRFCNKTYTKQANYSRHMNKGCKAKEIYEDQLEKRVLKERNKAAQNVNNQTINNNNINNTININMPTMRAFGDENYDYITTKYLLRELSRCGDMNDMSSVIGKFTRMIHANPAHPENHNVMLRSLNGGFARVFNGTTFEDRQAVDVQDDIIKKIGTHVIEMGDSLDHQQIQNIKLNPQRTNRLDDMQSALEEDINEGDNRKISKYRAKIKSALHSNKNTIHSTQRLLDSSTDNLTLLEEIVNPPEMLEFEE